MMEYYRVAGIGVGASGSGAVLLFGHPCPMEWYFFLNVGQLLYYCLCFFRGVVSLLGSVGKVLLSCYDNGRFSRYF